MYNIHLGIIKKEKIRFEIFGFLLNELTSI